MLRSIGKQPRDSVESERSADSIISGSIKIQCDFTSKARPLKSVTHGQRDARPAVTFQAAQHHCRLHPLPQTTLFDKHG